MQTAQIHSQAAAKPRETQALLGTLTGSVRMPSVVLLEILWRWAYGIPALLWLWRVVQGIGALIPDPQYQALQSQMYNPAQASILLAEIAVEIWPAVERALLRVALPLALGWVLMFALGRSLVTARLRRVRPELLPQQRPRVALFWIVLQVVRLALLALAFALFFYIVTAAARDCFPPGAQPNLVLYLTVVVFSAIAMFGAWAIVSFVVSVAPAVAAARPDLGLANVIRAAWHVRGVVEVNLVLGIVKLALIVLAMVFSAVPVPFAEQVTPEMFHTWWAIVTVWYLVTNDYFQAARWIEMLRLSRAASPLPG